MITGRGGVIIGTGSANGSVWFGQWLTVICTGSAIIDTDSDTTKTFQKHHLLIFILYIYIYTYIYIY